MARTASFTDDIVLTPGAPVEKPKSDTAPDLKVWIENLTRVDQATRQAGKTDISIPFNVPADRKVKNEDGTERTVSAAKTAKLRFQQAAQKMGVGVSITIEPVNETVSRLLVSTMARRERKPQNGDGATAQTPATAATEVPTKPQAPVGLPKVAQKR